MANILQQIQSRLTLSIPIAMLAGLILGAFFDTAVLKVTIIPLTFLMVYPMMINMNYSKLKEKGDLKLHLVTQIMNFAIIPFIALGIGQMMFTNPYHKLGLLLAALLPTSGMTISWTGFAKGNISAAIKMTVIGLLLGSFLTPVYLKLLLGAEVNIPLIQVAKQIAVVVLIPMIMGQITRKGILAVKGQAYFDKSKETFKQFSTIGVLGIVFVAMALKSQSIISNPAILLKLLLPITILYLSNFALSTLVAIKLFNYQDGMALVFGTVMRNLSIALAIAISIMGEQGSDVALVIAFSYIVQVQAGAWYVKLVNKWWTQAAIVA